MGLLSNYLSFLGPYAGLVENLIYIILVIILAIIIDRYALSRLKSVAKKLGAPPEIIKGIHIIFRFVIFVIAIMVIASIGLVPAEYIVGASALIGTALGFSLTRATSNFVSGAYVLVSGLFRIGDYIRVGGEEGVVVDMTINYTKIRRGDGTYFIISNSEILNKTVINFRISENEEEHYIYTIDANVESKVPIKRIKEVFEEIRKELKDSVEEIELRFTGYTRLETKFSISFKVREPSSIPIIASKIYEKLTEIPAS